MKAIQLLFNSQLPPDLRDYTRVLDAKSIGALMADIARKYPEQYERISKSISDIGRKASYYQGETLTLNDNRPVIDKDKIFGEMDKELSDAKANSASDSDYEQSRNSIWDRYNNRIQKETSTNALAQKNNLAYSVMSGARGKPPQLKMMLSTPGLYTDAQDNLVPMFIRNSFAEGLRPAEYLASTYGARKAVLCLHEDTLVRMSDGTSLPIKDIQEGMYVLGADTEGNTFPTRVTSVFKQGLQPVNKYVFRRGTSEGRHEVICTAKHKFLQNDYQAYSKTYNAWRKGKGPKPAASLLHKKEVYPIGESRTRQCAVLSGAMTGSYGYDEPYALLLGILTGDGCVTDKNIRLRLSCADEIMIKDLCEDIAHLNLKITDQRHNNFDWEIVQQNYNASQNTSIQTGIKGFVAGARMPHKQILINEGLAGCHAEEKSLPCNIHNWSNKAVLSYIAGLIATDGSIYFDKPSGVPRVSFAMTARNVVFGLHKLIAHRFGVYASEISFRDTGGFGDTKASRKNILWEFTVATDTAVKRLLKDMPRIPGLKETKKQRALSYKLKQENPYPKAKLEACTFIGEEQCYDIEVEHEDHLFVLDNGIITSNSTKRATAKGGDLAKQMVQSAARLVITENDCGVSNGIDLDTDDKSVKGRVLAKSVDGIPAGTVIDRHVIAQFRKHNVGKIIARSALTCQAKEGLCSKCIGLNPEGHFLSKGDSIGITSAQAIGEPITQGALNVKHTGGAVGANKRYEGFDVINQFVQTPDTFPDKSILASKDGTVNAVVPAPQGGHYITIDNAPHYVAPGYDLNVKVGDRVEAGDPLSAGLADPGEIVELRGLGEGRKYYANQLKELLDNSGMEADRRNTEILARAALDHVQINDAPDIGEYLPDDMASYNAFANTYVPPVNTAKTLSEKAVGQYLQSPALHYTIGTRVTPKISKHLMDSGFKEVFTSGDTPSFTPIMPRLRTATHNGTDWLASMHTSYLKKQLNESATRGEDSNIESNVHFAPRLAIGNNFADNIKSTGKF